MRSASIGYTRWLVRTRKIWLWSHLWLCLIGGLLVVVVSTTGSAIVFLDEADRWLNPALQHSSGPRVFDLDLMRQTAENAFPGEPAARIMLPATGARRAPLESYLIALQKKGDPSLRMVYVDPHTNRVLGSRWNDRWLLGVLWDIHIYFVRRLTGRVGYYTVGVAGILLALSALTGGILWWPLLERGFGLHVRMRQGLRRAIYDLHNVVGAYTLPLVLLVSLTGISLVFYHSLHFLLHLGTVPEPNLSTPHLTAYSAAPYLSLDELLARANMALPGARVHSIFLSRDPNEAVGFAKRLPGEYETSGFSRVWLDPRTGMVVLLVDGRQMTAIDTVLYQWMIRLHEGSFAGAPGRIIMMLVGLLPACFTVTGVWMWMYRRGWLPVSTRRRKTAARAPIVELN